jgi:putative FmdB family regulatory protein
MFFPYAAVRHTPYAIRLSFHMPLYEFKCQSCGHRFETFQFSTTRALPACPACNATTVEKQFSTFGVGSGGGTSSSRRTPVTFGGG